MADAIGSVCAALDPLRRLVEAHVMAAERLHGDEIGEARRFDCAACGSRALHACPKMPRSLLAQA